MDGFMRVISGRHGRSKIANLFILAVVVAVIYAVIQFVPPAVNYLKLKNIAYDVMNSVGDKGDDKILEKLHNMANSDNITLDPDAVTIQREESGPATLVIDYSEKVVLIKDKLEQTLNFHIEEKGR